MSVAERDGYPSGGLVLPLSGKVIRKGGISADPKVSGFDELHAEASILVVRVSICWHRWKIEVIERHEESHLGAVFGD